MLTMHSEFLEMRRIIDLERYPIDRLESDEGRALIDHCREDLERDGLFNLAGFMFPNLIKTLLPALQSLIDGHSFTHQRRHNIYFLPEVEGLAPEHPALREFDTVNHTVCADQIPGNPLFQLYQWPPFAAFLAAVMHKPALYPMDDPLACMNVMSIARNSLQPFCCSRPRRAGTSSIGPDYARTTIRIMTVSANFSQVTSWMLKHSNSPPAR